MKTELDKCMAGEWYDCHDPIFITQKGKTRQLLARYNALPYEEKKTKQEVLKEMFGSIGNNVSVGTPFLCDYGCNIHIGDNVSVNMNCSFIDCNKITIGSHVLIASNVQIYTCLLYTSPSCPNGSLPVGLRIKLPISAVLMHFL